MHCCIQYIAKMYGTLKPQHFSPTAKLLKLLATLIQLLIFSTYEDSWVGIIENVNFRLTEIRLALFPTVGKETADIYIYISHQDGFQDF